MGNLTFRRLMEPEPLVLDAMNRWGSDPCLAPLITLNPSEGEAPSPEVLTPEGLLARLEHRVCYVILQDGELIGEMTYRVDPVHLYRQVPGTAWLSILIGDPAWRGRGIGGRAMAHLEAEIQRAGLTRMELGVFEFNAPALRLYQRLGYQEIGRIQDFTYWQGRWWNDIRMEKFCEARG